jgi:predicted ester cyclase
MENKMEKKKEIATRFIHAFNTDDWDTVREVVAPNYVFHHPIGGTVSAGPEGMVGVWADFKASLPDSWHPIPVMITEGDYLAVLLPTYGHFTGKPYHGAPPTGKWLEYGMVNIVRFEKDKIAENWFGMDPLAEQQQMGAIPSFPQRQLNPDEKENIELFQKTVNTTGLEYDNLTAFGDIVCAMGPPQHGDDTKTRKVEIYKNLNGSLELAYSNEFTIDPPYSGDPAVDSELSRSLVTRFIKEVLIEHNLDDIAKIASRNILIHTTAMPCEGSYFGISGTSEWLSDQWKTFPDLSINDYFTVAQGDIVAVHWTASGTADGPFIMLPPTGKLVKYTGSSMYRIEEGKIAEIWETRNTLAIMHQLNPEIGGGNHGH